MNKQLKLSFTFIIFISVQTVFAQYGNQGYGGGYGGAGGYNNERMGGMNQQQREPEKPREIPAEETVGKIMAILKPELNLDALQEIAIKNILMENMRTQGIIIKKEISDEDKIKDIKALTETTDRKTMELLNKDQKIRYTYLKEHPAEKPKDKKKKKNKDAEKFVE